MQDLLNRKSELSDAKRALLEKRLRGQAHSTRKREVVTRCAGPGPDHPMSFAQERLWFVSQLEPGNPVYHVPVAVLIRADVDVPRLEAALSEVVRRHEALRTTFGEVNGELRQIVQPPPKMKVDVIDVREQVRAGGNEALRRAVSEEGARPIDITRDPMVRVSLLRVSDERYAMVTTVHHIATDGWAMPIVVREIDHVYTALANGEPHGLPEPDLRYADYAVWQRGFLQGETLERQVDYWREHLRGAPDVDVPGDRPRPADMRRTGSAHRFVVPPEVTVRLRELCRTDTVTLNMVILAAFGVLLERYTGSGDVVVGSLFGNRSRTELEQILGYFVNTGAVRLDLRDDPPFRELVQRARRAILDADANQDLPFEKLVERLGVARDPGRNPLFQVMYFHHTFVAVHHSRGEGMTAELDPLPIYDANPISLVDTGISKFDMTLATLESGEGLMGWVEYSTVLYDAASIERFCDHLVAILAAAGAGPDARASALPTLLPGERETLLALGTGAPVPGETPSVPAAVHAQAALTPHAPAVMGDDGATLTYRELEARAGSVAAALRAHGVRRGARVAVAIERSPDLAAALLGVLYAGAAYVPVDPEYPAERIEWMLRDSGAPVLLTSSALAPSLPRTGAAVVEMETIEAGPVDAPVEVDGGDTAYVIYTSGSTGRPKGVAVPHRAVANHTRWMQRAFPLAAGDRVLQKTPVTFDASVWEFWNPLAAGATLVMAAPDAHRDPLELSAAVTRHSITTLQVVPALLATLVDEPSFARCATLRRLFVGGDAFPAALARRAAAALPGAQVVNLYGPTETCVDATFHAVDAASLHADGVPLGAAVDGTAVYLLDGRGSPVPFNVTGELFVGGRGVATGYVGSPAATAERFLPDPFAAAPGARMYRTGDLARRRRDGTLEFAGRADFQAKVRGYRVEPGEVEGVLAQHPAVRHVAAAVRGEGSAARLVAWAAADGVDGAELRAFLATRLPAHLLPSAVQVLPHLPLTSSGKVDRAALETPAAPPVHAGGGAEPRTPVEAALARIWAEVLRRERVGVDENFFELGGDSILSIQVIVRAAREGIRVTPRQMFAHGTVAELAAVAGTAPLVVAEQGIVTGQAPLTPIQAAFFEQELPDAHHWNQAFLFRAGERIDTEILTRAVDALLAHHDALRARFVRTDEGWTQHFAEPGGPPSVLTVDLSQVGDDELPRAIAEAGFEAQSTLDLAEGPLFRAVLFECGPARPQRMILAAHHLVVDAVSWPVLTEDLEAAYRQLAAGAEVRLPPKTTSYAHWARRLAELARTPEVRAETAYWSGAVPESLPSVPVDHADGEDVEGALDAVFAELDEAETKALLEEVPPVYGTQVNDVLLAALAQAFAAWGGGDQLLVDVEGHGREDLFDDADTSRTVGWFTTLYPVHLRAAASAGDALRAAKETLRGVPRRGIGYGMLRWAGEPADGALLRSRARAQVSFNYLGQVDGGPMGGTASAAATGALLLPEAGSTGPIRSPRAPRSHRIAAEGMTAGGRLRIGFFYGSQLYERATVERLAAAYAEAVRAIIEHCRNPGAGGFTPSDFPEAGLDQGTLDALMAQLG